MTNGVPPDGDRRSVLKAAGALGAFFGSTGLASADDGSDSSAGRTELLVGVSTSTPDAESTVASALGRGSVVHSNETLHYVTVELPESTPAEAVESVRSTLEGIDAIEYVEENATLEAFSRPNDPMYDQQYAPQRIGCEEAWAETVGDGDVVLSIVDQGVEYDHENLEANVDDRIGAEFAGRGNDPYPVNSNETHGTIVAGIAGGVTNNRTGHAGISNCSMLCARALNERGSGSLADIADAIQWSADQGADVVNLSLGSRSGWHTLERACNYAVEQGTLLVGAAGNDGSSVSYPAAYDAVMAVSAVDSRDRLASFSNRGPEIDLAAPGVSVLSTTLNDGYTRASGTSMAAPVVAGVAGLVLSRYPDLTVDALREHLEATAEDVGLRGPHQGAGRINAAAAVTTVPEGHEPDDGDDGADEPDDGSDEPDEDDEDDEETDDGRDDAPDNLLAFVTDADAGASYYEFTVDGAVEFTEAPYESPAGEEIRGGTWSGDTIDERDDGTRDVSGGSSGGHGDAYLIDGAVTDIELDNPDGMWIELGGEERTPDEVIEETGGNDEPDEDDDESETDVPANLLAFVTDADAGASYYEFVADGPLEFAEAPYESPAGEEIRGGTWSGDTITENDDGTWTASGGSSGGHGDAYLIDGAVTEIDLDNPGGMWIELGGEERTPDEVIEETGGNQPDDDDENGEDDDDEQDDDEEQNGDDDSGGCGQERETASVDGNLSSGWWGYSDHWSYGLRTDDPCSLTITLEGPSDADFDLYVTRDGSRPGPSNYDEASTGSGSDEECTLDLSGDESVHALVYAVDGSGSYRLTFDELGR
ncbi:S8 family serine peptidase [Natrarchaeobaculum aegyptiacum]|uniref:Peptidase S8/S53 domain-containing protein n=1 Tax=Natrarchaeobaculum aegyptiacum TaxID=745377 RepID=A0A2Z2HYG2_9EURY|nr:S8 family serine peptidase [Natrarchaeobaculum aegyptiacum]ARS90807.1 hypothetical protein B1756_14465 [Natrarchaeobaculum aegyptiacum]